MLSSLLRKLKGDSVPTKANPRILPGFDLPDMPPIQTYTECRTRLEAAGSSALAIAIVRAYIQPKVKARGELGDPLMGLSALEKQVPQRRTEIQLVRRAVGLHCRTNAHGHAYYLMRMGSISRS